MRGTTISAAGVYSERIRHAGLIRHSELTGPATAATPAYHPEQYHFAGFRYGYICRLLDDSELEIVAPCNRKQVRKTHRMLFARALKGLRRDCTSALRRRRELMADNSAWNFESMLGADLAVRYLTGLLVLASIMHAMHAHAGVRIARRAAAQLEILTTGAAPVPAMST